MITPIIDGRDIDRAWEEMNINMDTHNKLLKKEKKERQNKIKKNWMTKIKNIFKINSLSKNL